MIIVSGADYVVQKLNYESIISLIEKSNKEIRKENIFIVAMIVPLLEEVLFRLINVQNRINVSIFVLFLSFYIINGSFTNLNILETKLYIKILTSISISVLSYQYYRYYASVVSRNQKNIIILSIILFGLAHISNIKPFYSQLILLYPFFVIPQMIMGYFITNVRIKLGFFWGVLLHCLINFVSLI